jgi:hypothetical protein
MGQNQASFFNQPFASPEKPTTFAVPNRQTDNGFFKSKSCRRKIESCGTSRKVCLSYPLCNLSKVLENLFSKALAKAEKSAVPLQPASIGGGKAQKAKQKKSKFFSRKA